MDGVTGNTAGLPRNCSDICINDESVRGQFGGQSLVKTSCKPEPHVFHLGCITKHLNEQSETSLDKRRCKCEQPALPLIREGAESVNDDESPYCESRMLNVCRSGNLRKLNWFLDKEKTLAKNSYRSALTGHPEYLLAVALKHQHTDLARTLIDHGADVNAADHEGETPLHITARLRRTGDVKMLIEAGANINNLLRTAIREDEAPLLQYLISTELSQSNLNIALHEAAGRGQTQHLKPLNKMGANDLNCAMREAAGQGETQCLERLISMGANDFNGALCEAAGRGQTQYFAPLIRKGANDLNGALRKAAEQGQRQCMEPLISAGATDLNGALCTAAEQEKTDCLELLINRGANELNRALYLAVQAQKNASQTVLVEKGANITTVVHTAARQGDWEFFNHLNDPTQINATDGEGQTPLHIATKISISEGRQQCAAMGIDINATFINGKTPEHYTIEKENGIGCLRELTNNRGVDFNARDNDGITPLMIAALWGKLDRLTYLLKSADINIAANCGTTALHLAAGWGRTDCLVKLLDREVDVNVKTHKDGVTPLHMAAQNGHIKSVEKLLKNDQTSVNEKMNDGCTPLHLAVRNGHTEIVRAFMEIASMRIQVDVKNNDGETALHFAARNGQTEAIQALLDLAFEKNKDGRTALYIAAYHGHKEFIQALLKSAPSLAYEKDNDGLTALHIAAEQGHTEIIQALLESAPTLANEKDNNGATALHFAAYSGQKKAIEALLEKAPSLVNEKNIMGQTALDCANKKGHTACKELLELFIKNGAHQSTCLQQ